jgi:hypothetical protein
MVWWIVAGVVVLLVVGWVVSRRRQGKERYRPNQAALNRTKYKDQGRW